MSHGDSLSTRVGIYLNEMDLESQRKVGFYYKVTIISVALISFVVAQFLEHFSICVYSTLASMVFCLVFMVPAWPIWKKHSLMFERPVVPPPPQEGPAAGTEAEPLITKKE